MIPIRVDEEFIKSVDVLREPKGEGLLESCSDNIGVFAEKMLGVRLYAWQMKVLSSITDPRVVQRFFVVITSRQIGKSLSVAVLSLWGCIFNKFPGGVYGNTAVGIVSASDDQAKKLLYEMKRLIRMGDLFIKENYVDEDGKSLLGDEFFSDLLAEDEPNNTTTITFKSHNPDRHGEFVLVGSKTGSFIKSYPPTSKVLGNTFSLVVIDEAGLTESITDKFFDEYILPTGNKMNARFIVLSTPWQPAGIFYRLVDPDNLYEERKDLMRFSFDVDAIRLEDPEYHKGLMERIRIMKSDGKLAEVQRAYYCRFVKDEKVFFDPDKVRGVFDKELFKHEKSVLPVDLGVDFGAQKVSQTVLTLTRLSENKELTRVYDHVYGATEDETLIEDIKELKKRFNVQRIIPEVCPQGNHFIKKMIDLGWDVHPVEPRTDKVRLYGAMRSKVHTGKVKSYSDDKLLEEFLAVENHPSRQRSNVGVPVGYSDDRIDSFVYSSYFFLDDDEEGVKTFDWDNDETKDDEVFTKKELRGRKKLDWGVWK